MKTQPGLLLSAPVMLLGLGLAPTAFAKNNKVDICHLTSSATNPSVLINVSVNAAAAHYGHGDPVDFTVLPNGKCVANSAPPPPPPPPPVTEKLCMTSDFFDGSKRVWIVDYNLLTGEFTGSSAGAAALSGGADPADGVPVAHALFTDGTAIDVAAGTMLGLANGATTNGGGLGANGFTVYEIELYSTAAPTTPIGYTSLTVHGATLCTELGGNTPIGM